MRVLQQLPARCTCPLCKKGCLCGDCSLCSNPALDRLIFRNAKILPLAALLIAVFAGFVFFVPVVSLAATPTITQTFALRVQPAENATVPMGSIAFCYFGHGAVLIHGVYYPSVALNQSARRVCGQG